MARGTHKIYNDQHLPPNLTNIHVVAQCIEQRFLKGRNWTGCGWEPRICDRVHVDVDTSATDNLHQHRSIQMFLNYKSNYASDMAYLQWFQKYPYQTTDPAQADLFLVPYLHKSVCLCHHSFASTSSRCSLSPDKIRQAVMRQLPHYKEYKQRHLFLLLEDYSHNKRLLRSIHSSMSLTLGPMLDCQEEFHQPCGHIVSPYMNFVSSLQPPAVQNRSKSWWLDHPRTYAVGALMNAPPHLKMRHQMAQNVSAYFPERIGGKPSHVHFHTQGRPTPSTVETMQLYRNSTFCPILAGDDAVQKRFFDVMLQGCIPLVPYFTPSLETGYPTFFQWKNRPSIRQTYPWAKGSFVGDVHAGIDYETLVLAFDGFAPLTSLLPTVEEALSNKTQLNELRTNLMTYAPLFSFGLEENLQVSVDGFAAMFVSVRHYLYSLTDRPSPMRHVLGSSV